MAIWQYLLIVVPENSIDDNYNIFENNETGFLPETNSYWENFDGSINSIISELNQILPKASWSDEIHLNWKGNGNNDEDNDAFICLTDDKSKIKEFQFRIDLRKASNITNILQSILELCKRHNLVLIDLKGKILKPELKDISESIRTSNASSFVTDPMQFFENLSNQSKIETSKNTSKIYPFEKLEIIKSLVRISSWFLILILFFAMIITLLSDAFGSYFINYFVVFLSIFILLINASTLLVISILYKSKKEKVFYNIKKEFILFLVSIASLMLLSGVIHFKI
ncbi:hypothetical protein ACFSJW_04785 [Flavobacterium artemisiae]|uniref:Uncharacterized protein n=1 Tax=Flavobacterium artemisiae TaxID=2126556 RepID=A0ABW4HM13_9FLAO